MSLLLLGPTKWIPGYRPKTPGWVTNVFPPGRVVEGSPVPSARDVRCGLVARLRLANVKATMMELHEDHAGEDPEEKLARVIREDKVDQYAMFWPWGGTRSGLDVEIGWLLKSIRVGEVDSDNVAVFYEWNPEGRRAADIVTRKDGTGAFQSLEDHRRTTYYESLVARGAVPIAWSTYEDLLEFMVEFGRSLPP